MKELKNKLWTMMNIHSDMELKFFVTSEEVLEDYHYSQQVMQSVEISEWCEYNGSIYTDISELADELVYENENLTDEEAEEEASEMMDQVILVTLGA